MSKKPVPSHPSEINCMVCAFIASSVVASSAKNFKDQDGELVKLQLDKAYQPGQQGLRFHDGRQPALCGYCAQVVLNWLKERERRHFETKQKQPPRIVPATPAQMKEVLDNVGKANQIIRPGVGGRVL